MREEDSEVEVANLEHEEEGSRTRGVLFSQVSSFGVLFAQHTCIYFDEEASMAKSFWWGKHQLLKRCTY